MVQTRETESEDQRYLEFVDRQFVPDHEEFLVTTHVPRKFNSAYHHHASVEVNFLRGCELEYSFSGHRVTLDRRRVAVFWGSIPHSVVAVHGSGSIVNIYVSLAQFLKWGLPAEFREAILGGSVLVARDCGEWEDAAFSNWAADFANPDPAWRQLLLGEIRHRITRMALQGYSVLLTSPTTVAVNVQGAAAMRHTDRMLRFIAENYELQVSVDDVARHAGLSSSYAMMLFKQTVGVPIMTHVNHVRLSHAQMLLATSDAKILSIALDCGFNSLSSFYAAFRKFTNMTPAAFRLEVR